MTLVSEKMTFERHKNALCFEKDMSVSAVIYIFDGPERWRKTFSDEEWGKITRKKNNYNVSRLFLTEPLKCQCILKRKDVSKASSEVNRPFLDSFKFNEIFLTISTLCFVFDVGAESPTSYLCLSLTRDAKGE